MLQLTRILQTVNGKVYFPLLLIAAMTTPMQGLPNFLVYLRPRWQSKRLQRRQQQQQQHRATPAAQSSQRRQNRPAAAPQSQATKQSSSLRTSSKSFRTPSLALSPGTPPSNQPSSVTPITTS
jgi:hypothetical protein